MRARWLAALALCGGCDADDPIPAVRVGTPCPEVVAREVNDQWIATHPFWGGTAWQRATYFMGNLAAADTFGVPAYLDYTLGWADYWEYELNGPTDTRNAQNHAAGQVYLDLYDRNPDPALIADTASSLDFVIRYSDGRDWSWTDALFFASPTFAHMGEIAGNTRYHDKMFALFSDARDRRRLFDASAGLWYRDENYVEERTGDDRKVFWSRGNGFVMASLVRTLDHLRADSPYRAAYEEMLVAMAAAVAPVQRSDGLWNTNLANPDGPPGPEASGTALFAYALAKGINDNLLPRGVYLPVVERAWRGLVSVAVREDRQLGYVQGEGEEPSSSQPVTLRSTADYGVGAFLLAATEVSKLGLDLECP